MTWNKDLGCFFPPHFSLFIVKSDLAHWASQVTTWTKIDIQCEECEQITTIEHIIISNNNVFDPGCAVFEMQQIWKFMDIT